MMKTTRAILILLLAAFLVTAGAETLLAADVSQDATYLWKAPWRGNGFYLSWMKIATVWLLFLAWVGAADWVNRDLEDTGLKWQLWNPIIVGSFMATMLLSWLIPWFWLNIFLLLAGAVAPVATYIVLSQPPHADPPQGAHAGPHAVLVLGTDEDRRREGCGRGGRRQHRRRARQGLCPRRRRPDHRRRPAAGCPAIRRTSPGPQDPVRGTEVAGLGDRAGLRAHDRRRPLPGRRRVDAPGADRARGGRPGPGGPEGPLRPGAQGAAGQAGGQVRRGVLGAAERRSSRKMDKAEKEYREQATMDLTRRMASEELQPPQLQIAVAKAVEEQARQKFATPIGAWTPIDKRKAAETAGHRGPAPRDVAGAGQDRRHPDLPRHADRRAGRRGVRGQRHSPGHAGRSGHAGQDAGAAQGDPQSAQGFRDPLGHSRRRPADDDQGRALQSRPLRAGVRRRGGRGQSLRRDREHRRDHLPAARPARAPPTSCRRSSARSPT